MQCLFTDRAERDLTEIRGFIAADNPVRALSFVGEVREACLGITNWPEANPVAVVLDGRSLRRLVFGRYLIFYLVEDENVIVVRVLHGARNVPDLLG